MMAAWDEREYGPQVVRSLHSTRRDFRRVWPWLAKAVEQYGPTHTMDGVWSRIANGDSQLWTNQHSAVVTSVERYPDTGLVEVHGWLAGGMLDGVRHLEGCVERWARSIGASRIMIVGRRGWLRGFDGYRELVTTMTKDLT